MQLFPQLADVLLRGVYGDYDRGSLWREQRVSSLDYLRRYLTYSIPEGDISDQVIDEFLLAAATYDGNDLAAIYKRLLSSGEDRAILMKLKSRIQEIPLDSAKRICICASRLGALISESHEEISEPRDILGFMVRLVLKRIEGNHREAFAIEIIEAAEPLQLLLVCLEWMRPQRNEVAHEQPFSLDGVAPLEKAAANRISQYAAQASLITGHPPVFGRLLLIWQRAQGSGPVKQHVNKVLTDNPSVAGELLKPFSSFGATGSQGMDQERYDLIAKVVDPEVLMTALKETQLLQAETDSARIAQDFARIYRQTTGEHSSGNFIESQ